MAPRIMICAYMLVIASTHVRSGTVCAESNGELSVELDALSRLHTGRSMRVSSADPNWRSGNRDSRPISPGQTLTIADIDGPGVIRHIWFTINAEDPRCGRSLSLRFYWDHHDEPAVESPIGDFFAVGHGARRCVNSLPVSVTSEGRALSCFWSMPFAKHARITLSNDSPDRSAKSVYWYVDYEKVAQLPPDTPYFHAQYRQEFPAQSGRNYLILDAQGRGHYVGTALSAYSRTAGWFGEGDDFFFIDGETEPSLRGTGTEDYFGDAWGFREFDRPYHGVVLFDGFEVGDRTSVYRWHIKDPVRFERSLKVEIEHKGAMVNDQGKFVSGFEERPDLFSSVAYWYQTGVAKRYATLPPARDRVVPQLAIEFEDLREVAQRAPAETSLEKMPSGMFSHGAGLLARFAGEKALLTVPFQLDSAFKGVARLRLATSWDSGVWSVSLDGKALPADVDLYTPNRSVREVRIGMVDFKPGEHTIRFENRGKNPAATGYFLGADVLAIDEITAYSLPTTLPAAAP